MTYLLLNTKKLKRHLMMFLGFAKKYNGCVSIGLITNEEFLVLSDFDLPSFIDSAPSFEITSNLTDWPNLSDYDID